MSRRRPPAPATPPPAFQPGVRPYQDRFPGKGTDLRWALREAEVVRVDYERMVCDLRYLSGAGQVAREVPLSSAAWGPRSFLGAMPEEGSIVLVGYAPAHHHHAVQPYIVTSLPNGYKTALNWAPFGGTSARQDPALADATLTELTTFLEGYYGPRRHKFRKILPGDLLAMSSAGGEALWSAGVTLRDRLGSSLSLDGYRGQAEIRASGAVRAGAPGWSLTSGLVDRPDRLLLPEDLTGPGGTVSPDDPLFPRYLDLGWIDQDGVPAPDLLAAPRPDVLGDGTRRVRVQAGPPRGADQPEDPSRPWLVEHRLALRWDVPNPTAPPSPARAVEGPDPLLGPPDQEVVIGSVVGADPWTREGRPGYGLLLRPALWEDPRSTTASPGMVPLTAAELAWGSEGEAGAAAFLYRMRRRDPAGGELFLAHDREGHVFLNVPASGERGSSLGAGRSMEVALAGSLKMVVGANQPLRSSWDLDAAGGARWNWGAGGPASRAMDVTGAGGFQWVSRSPDAEGLGWRVVTEGGGDAQVQVSGALYQEAAGAVFMRAGGPMTLNGQQLNLYSGAAGTQLTSSGAERHIVTLAQDHQVGKGRNVDILAPLDGSSTADQLSITLGGRSAQFLAPAGASDEVSWPAGAGSASWTALTNGDWSFSALTGTFQVSYATSDLTLTPTTGTVGAPLVNLGSVGVRQGVVLEGVLGAQLTAIGITLGQVVTALNVLAPGSVTIPYVPPVVPVGSLTVRATP